MVRPDQPCGLEPIPGSRSSGEAQVSPRPCLSGDEPGRFPPSFDHGLVVKYLKCESETCSKIYRPFFVSYKETHEVKVVVAYFVLCTNDTFSAYFSSGGNDDVGRQTTVQLQSSSLCVWLY